MMKKYFKGYMSARDDRKQILTKHIKREHPKKDSNLYLNYEVAHTVLPSMFDKKVLSKNKLME